MQEEKVNIITDPEGRKIVLINDLLFKSRKSIDWEVVEQLVEIAIDKRERPDYDGKHGNEAKYGWYRYTTYFGIPIYSENGILERYSIFTTTMLVRRDVDGKLYLYDFVGIKKEGVQPA